MTTATSKNLKNRGQVRSTGANGSKPSKRFLPLEEYKRRQQAETSAFLKSCGG